jgi:hypothetical protein
MLTVISNKPSTVFPHTYWLREHSRVITDRYFDALGAGHAPVVPYVFRSQKGKPSSSSSLGALNIFCSAETPAPEPRWSVLLATSQGSTGCSHSSTFHQTRGPCSIRTGRCRHQVCTRTCAGATGVVLTHKRSWTEIFMSHPHHHRDIDLSPTFPLARRPVSQIVTPFCLSRSLRSGDPREPGWKVMLAVMVGGDEVLTNCAILTSARSTFQTQLGAPTGC